MKKRIWELDALRGFCILCVIAIHLIFDLTVLFPIVQWDYPDWFVFVQEWGGVIFLMLSGICVTLGSRSVRRGCIVFACGMLCTAVTFGMYMLNMADSSFIIRFGVLHCLGICMLLWWFFRKCPTWALVLTGLVIVLIGFEFANTWVENEWLFPLGLKYLDFTSGDYFPLLPHFGFFLLGAAMGKTVYAKKQSLLPRVNDRIFPLNALQFIGRHSLWVYLLHQPVLAGICYLLSQ